MSAQTKYRNYFLLIFLLSVSLRLWLVLVNRDFNDNHMGVVHTIMLRNKLPVPSSDPKTGKGGESFQPKLYHYTVAKIASIAGIDPLDKNHLILTGQLVNFGASVVLLAVVWVFINQFASQDQRIKHWAFALVGLNPPLLGINSQATNDTFVILFATLAIYFCYLFLTNEKWTFLILSILSSSLAVASKTNGWVAVIAIFSSLLIKSVSPKVNTKRLLTALAFPAIIAIVAIFNPLTQYRVFYKEFGTPFLINLEPAPAPYFFTKTSIPYAGILSIQDGFFTFKYLSILKTPYIEVYPELVQPHRTSFWTLMFAQSQSIHFNSWPPTWSDAGILIFSITRGLFIVGVLPILLILLGVAADALRFAKNIFGRNQKGKLEYETGLFLLVFAGYLGFVVLYAFIYRIFTVIGIHFLLPGLLAFIGMFVRGTEEINSLFQNSPNLTRACDYTFAILIFLYMLEIGTLINHLYHVPNPFL